MLDCGYVDSETIKLLGQQASGVVFSGDYVDWALAKLMAGETSRHLCILAGMEHEPLDDVRVEFKRALKELQISVDESFDVYSSYARIVAQETVAGVRSPCESLHAFCEIYYSSGYRDEYVKFIDIEEGVNAWDANDGVYDSLCPELRSRSVDEVIRDECDLFLALFDAILPSDIYSQAYCKKCGLRAPLVLKRKLFSKKQVWRCCACGGIDYISCASMSGRKLIVSELRALGVKTLPERGMMPR